MVRSLVLKFVSGVALVSMSLAAMPSTASAQATGQQFKTAITEVYGSTYPLTGRLDLELSSSGTIRGFYHTTFDKLFIPVAGGRDGDYIWFDIGPSSIDLGLGAGPQGKLHVVATVNGDGSLKGQVYRRLPPCFRASRCSISLTARRRTRRTPTSISSRQPRRRTSRRHRILRIAPLRS